MFKPIYVAYLALALVIISAIAYACLPASKLTTEEYKEIQHWLYTQNKNLPEASELGTLLNVEFKKDTFIWHLSVQGDDALKGFYESNKNLITSIFKKYILILSKSTKTGKTITNLIEKDINFKYVISFSDGSALEHEIQSSALKQFLSTTDLSKEEALAEILLACISIYNEYGVETPFHLALSNLFSDINVTSEYAWNRNDDEICINFSTTDDELFYGLYPLSTPEYYDELEKLVCNNRMECMETDFLLNTIEIADAKLVFRLFYYDNCIELQIPTTKAEEIKHKETLKKFHNLLNN